MYSRGTVVVECYSNDSQQQILQLKMTSIDQLPKATTRSYPCIKNDLAFGLFTLIIIFFSITSVHASEIQQSGDDITKWHFSSGPKQTQVLELFTSEGCSSCPPADRWLSNLKNSPDLWVNIIPIAFHVDYWNNLGWKDPFSSRQHSLRQRTYRELRYVNGVYTPGFILNGLEWRGWFNREALPNNIPNKTHKDVGELSLEATKLNNKILFNAIFMRPGAAGKKIYRSTSSGQLTLNVALLAMNQKTDVTLGENRGKTLHHDFVVTSLQSMPYPVSSVVDEENLPLYWQGELDLNQCTGCAIAAWISKADDQQPIQATGGYLW